MAVLSRFGFLFRRNTALSDKLLGELEHAHYQLP